MTKKTSLWQRLKDAFRNAEPNPPTSDTATFPQSLAEQNLATQDFGKQDLTGQVIVDLTENSAIQHAYTSTENALITADDIDVMLASMGYHFSYHPPKVIENESPIHHFSMRVSDGQVADGEREWGCLLRFFENEQLLAVYSIFPFSVPDSHRGEMLAVMAYLNYDLVIGNLELDVHDGEVRFKTSLDLEVTGLSHEVLWYLLQSNFAVTARLHDTLWEVVAKSAPAVTASEAVDNLLASQQANTFYLMTDTIS